MSYEPTNWKTGDVVTSAKLNKLENAVAQSGGAYIVHVVKKENSQNPFDLVTQETAGEIFEAVAEGNVLLVTALTDQSDVFARMNTIVKTFSYMESPSDGNHKYFLETFENNTFPITQYIADDASEKMVAIFQS